MGANSFYNVLRGVQIDDGIALISGSGAPGASGDSTTVVVGSFYLDTSTGNLYTKDTAGSGTDKWAQYATQDYVTSQVGAGISWREPVLVRDNTLYANITAAETAANVADTVDGVTITAGDRLLFTNLTTGNENVYIVSGSSGSWTFTEDSNTATSGDTVYVQSGTDAGKRFTYNGTAWVLSNQSDLDELGYIRSFIGKNAAGSETPSYSSSTIVGVNDDLETAIGKLDAEAGYVLTFIGKAAGSDTPSYSSQVYITNADSLETALGKLDAGLARARTEVTSTNITTSTVVDSVVVDTTAAVKWMVHVQGNAEANAHLKAAFEIFATHDGHNVGATDDATAVDDNISKLKLGTITGLDVTVDINGAAGAQVMRLNVVSTTAVDVRLVREVINF